MNAVETIVSSQIVAGCQIQDSAFLSWRRNEPDFPSSATDSAQFLAAKGPEALKKAVGPANPQQVSNLLRLFQQHTLEVIEKE